MHGLQFGLECHDVKFLLRRLPTRLFKLLLQKFSPSSREQEGNVLRMVEGPKDLVSLLMKPNIASVQTYKQSLPRLFPPCDT